MSFGYRKQWLSVDIYRMELKIEWEREMNTRRLIQLTELWSEQIEARLWDMFRPDPLGGAISRQSRLVYICVGHTVWRVIGVWGYKSRVEVRCITFLNRSYQRVIFGYSFEEWNVLMYRLLQCMFEQLDRRYLMRQPVKLSVDMLLWYAQVTLRLLWMLGMIGYRSQGR